MNKTNQLICAHSGLAFAILMGLGIFVVAGWLPPHLPSASATDIAHIFQQDTTRIRVGMTILAAASVLWWALAAAIATQMRRIEGEHHPMTYLQMASASGSVVAILIPAYFWLAVAYRPETSPEVMQIFNDFSWLVFIGAYPPGLIQNLSIGFCILSDKRQHKIYPRWVGFANFWIAVGFLPGALLPYFKTGPFAWNGIIGFWLVAGIFFFWIMMMWWMTVKAIKQQAILENETVARQA